MKKWLCAISVMFLLAGCGTAETFETISDEWDVPAMAAERDIAVDLPGEASVCAVSCDTGRLYLCNEYEISIETMRSGDLYKTIHDVSGQDMRKMTVMSTEKDGVVRHEFAWSTAGENGDRLGRCVVLDDGNYHYVLSVLRDADPVATLQIQWDSVFQSFKLV